MLTVWVGHRSIGCVLCPVTTTNVSTLPLVLWETSLGLPLTGLNKQILVEYLWNEQPRIVETMAQVPPGMGAGGVARQEGLHRTSQGDGEVGVGLQTQVKLSPASSWLGLGWVRSGDIYPVFIIQ